LLAQRLERRSVDVDQEIERDCGLSVADLVDRDGMAAFRVRERSMISRLVLERDLIISLGGGALEDPGTRDLLEGAGLMIFLDASLASCTTRTAKHALSRPLLNTPGALATLHAQRRPRYRMAAVHVDADGSPEATVDRIVRELNARRDILVATAKPYEVEIGAQAIAHLPDVVMPQPGGRVLVIADERVRSAAWLALRAYTGAGIPATLMFVQADESLKSLAELEAMYARFASAGVDRRGLIVGVGGGTISDAVGFAAATYQRGVPYVGVPTTLLAAVDAAIGGKTALNLPTGKNLVGTVTQPAHVAIAPWALRSLDARDIVSGWGEMLKYGLALDAPLYDELRAAETAFLQDPASALDALARCVELKAEIVARDEEDVNGARAVLNFGHTVGHALERVAGYGALRHGEAVIVGMRAALVLSQLRGGLDRDTRVAIDDHLASLPVDDAWRALDRSAVAAATASDKKRHAGGTRYVLLDGVGTSVLDDAVTGAELDEALRTIGLA
jgi:3-dehydroquinate synthetase/shikimate kinase